MPTVFVNGGTVRLDPFQDLTALDFPQGEGITPFYVEMRIGEGTATGIELPVLYFYPDDDDFFVDRIRLTKDGTSVEAHFTKVSGSGKAYYGSGTRTRIFKLSGSECVTDTITGSHTFTEFYDGDLVSYQPQAFLSWPGGFPDKIEFIRLTAPETVIRVTLPSNLSEQFTYYDKTACSEGNILWTHTKYYYDI